MSRLEPDAFVDYDTMADKLKARRPFLTGAPSTLLAHSPAAAQIIRKRLNTPLTLAEKVRSGR
jgi:hypothetical protein